MLIEGEKQTNTDYAVTAWMIHLVPHIREDVFKNSNLNNMNEVNTVIKTLFYGFHDKELYETHNPFWNEYTKFNHKNDLFNKNEFIWSSKNICDGNIHLWHQK